MLILGPFNFLTLFKSVQLITEVIRFIVHYRAAVSLINLLTPNDDYNVSTAPLTSKCCFLYIYSTNIGT